VEPGVFEKRITLAIADRVNVHLGKDRNVKVVLCRQRDEFMTIRSRVRCANEAGASLFVSIHANAALNRGSDRGFELYVLPVANADRVAALQASRATGTTDAIWRLNRTRELVEQSLEAAKRLQWELADTRGKSADRGIKQNWAALDVLEGLTMPGILVEVGYIDHVEEGIELLRPQVQDAIAEALARALGDLAARARRARTDPTITAPPSERARR
jgi:N-acetylmuramoyl-L-alanine amidase